jgi:hypothetical protein
LFHEAFFREIVGIKIYFPPNSSSYTIHTHQERNREKKKKKEKRKSNSSSPKLCVRVKRLYKSFLFDSPFPKKARNKKALMTQFPGKTKTHLFSNRGRRPKEKVEEEEYIVRCSFRYTAVGLNCSLLPIQKLALIANQTAIDSESFGAVDVGSCCCCLNDENFYFTSFATKKYFKKPNPGPLCSPNLFFLCRRSWTLLFK